MNKLGRNRNEKCSDVIDWFCNREDLATRTVWWWWDQWALYLFLLTHTFLQDFFSNSTQNEQSSAIPFMLTVTGVNGTPTRSINFLRFTKKFKSILRKNITFLWLVSSPKRRCADIAHHESKETFHEMKNKAHDEVWHWVQLKIKGIFLILKKVWLVIIWSK